MLWAVVWLSQPPQLTQSTQSSTRPTRPTRPARPIPTEALSGATLLDKYKAWMIEQMDTIAPSLHRAEYRSRINARAMHPTDAGLPRPACSIGSRWQRFSFNSEDFGKQVAQCERARSCLCVRAAVKNPMTQEQNRMIHQQQHHPSPRACIECSRLGRWQPWTHS